MNKKSMLLAGFVAMAAPLGLVAGCAVDATTPAETPAVGEPPEKLDMASSGGVGWVDDAGYDHYSPPWGPFIYFGATAAPANGLQLQP